MHLADLFPVFRRAPQAGGDQFAHVQELLGHAVVELDEQLLVGDQLVLPDAAISYPKTLIQ